MIVRYSRLIVRLWKGALKRKGMEKENEQMAEFKSEVKERQNEEKNEETERCGTIAMEPTNTWGLL